MEDMTYYVVVPFKRVDMAKEVDAALRQDLLVFSDELGSTLGKSAQFANVKILSRHHMLPTRSPRAQSK